MQINKMKTSAKPDGFASPTNRRHSPDSHVPIRKAIRIPPFASPSKGSISIYITLVILITVISSALILSSNLSRQIRISENIISSERAFYAAGSGVEEALYAMKQRLADIDDTPFTINGTIPYDDENAEYSGSAALFFNELLTTSRPCIRSTGTHRQEERRINLKRPNDEC